MGERTGHGRCWRVARSLLLAGALTVTLALATGCGGSDGASDGKPDATPASAATGPVRYAHARELFRQMCAGCHTLADAGAHGDRLNLDIRLRDAPNRYEFARAVMKRGFPGMPSWRGALTPAEIESLARYIQAVAGQRDRSGDGRETTQLTPVEDRELLEEHPFAHGKALFKETCSGCHTLADANATGKRFDLDEAFAGGTLTAEELRDALHGRPGMPDWTRALAKEEQDALATYVPAVAGKG
jgi:mono/diheme cytochrome c family protein